LPTYQVKLHRDANKALPTLPAHIRNAAHECIEDILPYSSLTRIPGKTKQRKGRLAGIMQYDLPSGYRPWCQVDQETHIVYVIYLIAFRISVKTLFSGSRRLSPFLT
jgi:mRNA-degrading endonuclease RelE of RelBE toxin-antitoxin system